jgi:hypothetical protein
MISMVTKRYRQEKAVKMVSRPEGNNLQRKVRRAGPSDLGGEKRQARNGLGSQI